MTTLKLIEPDESVPKLITGDEVLREVAALIASRLPHVPVHDPQRSVVQAIGCVRAVPRGRG